MEPRNDVQRFTFVMKNPPKPKETPDYKVPPSSCGPFDDSPDRIPVRRASFSSSSGGQLLFGTMPPALKPYLLREIGMVEGVLSWRIIPLLSRMIGKKGNG
jgi:hypothetical protein